MSEEEFVKKINAMSREEILKYHGTAKTMRSCIGVLAVVLLFFTLMYAGVITVLLCALAVYHLAKLHTDITDTQLLLVERLERLGDR